MNFTRILPDQKNAFTLLELLLVVVFLSILLGVAAPAIHGALQASHLKDAANVISNRISEARQLAISLGVQTEVRLLKQPSLTGSSSRAVLRKVQVLTLQLGGGDADTAAGQPEFAPVSSPESWSGNVVISDDPDVTSLCDLEYQRSDGPGGRVAYLSFRFHPDGSTTLPVGKLWYLTVMDQRHVFGPALPKNFITLQIDPSSGRVRQFQPE